MEEAEAALVVAPARNGAQELALAAGKLVGLRVVVPQAALLGGFPFRRELRVKIE